MRTFILMLAIAGMVSTTACTSQKGNNGTADTTETTTGTEVKALKERVEHIYNDLMMQYDKEDFNRENLYKLYCTASYQKLQEELDRYCEETEDIGIDYDEWIQGQDYYEFRYNIDSARVADACRARVYLTLTNCGEKDMLMLDMALEDGEWRINDFVNNGPDSEGKGSRSEMEDILKEWRKTKH